MRIDKISNIQTFNERMNDSDVPNEWRSLFRKHYEGLIKEINNK